MIQKCARAALDVLDVPLATLIPELTMSPTDNLALESDGGSGWQVGWHIWLAVPLRVPTYPNHLTAGRECSRDRGEG